MVDFRREAADFDAPRNVKTERQKRKKRDRQSEQRLKCIHCTKAARTSLRGWARGMCLTHADEYHAEIPQNGNGRSTTKDTKKEKDRNKGVKKKVMVKKEPKVIVEATSIKNEVKKKTKKRTGRVSENAAKEDLGEEGEAAGCTSPKRLKSLRRFDELSKTQEKRKKIWRLNPHPHPAMELSEDFENSEFAEDAEDSEDSVSEGQLSEENASEQDLPTP